MNRTNSVRKAPLSLIILNLLALAGIGISVSLTQHFYEVRNGSAGFKSFCNIGQNLNCDVIAASPYAELFLGIPLSTFGAGWFLALFLTSLIAYNPFWRREAIRACLGISSIGVFVSIFYFLIMAVQLKTYCLLCLITDGISIATLFIIFTLKPEGFSQHKLDFSKWKAITGVIAGSLATAVVGLRSMDSTSLPATELNDLTNVVLNTPAVSVSSGSDLPSIGPASAPITIVEFSDFQCPYCRIGAFTIQSMMNRYPGKIRVVFRNFPLDQSCNTSFQHTAHPYACEAAKLALCAQKINKFESLYEQFFEKQTYIAQGQAKDLVKSVGLDVTQIQNCTTNPEINLHLAKDIEEANLLGVKSTPTFFINGHKMEGAFPVPVWYKIIDSLLKK